MRLTWHHAYNRGYLAAERWTNTAKHQEPGDRVARAGLTEAWQQGFNDYRFKRR